MEHQYNQLDASKSCAVLVVSPLMVDQILIVAYRSIIVRHNEIMRRAAEVVCDKIYDHCVPGSLSSPPPSVRAREPGDEATQYCAFSHYW